MKNVYTIVTNQQRTPTRRVDGVRQCVVIQFPQRKPNLTERIKNDRNSFSSYRAA